MGDADLIEEMEDSHDDTKDSVFTESNIGSGSLSRQDSGGSLTHSRTTKTKKTSRTNLSEASVDTGIVGVIDNKENFNDENTFTRPSGRPSKLKQPESYQERSSRSSSRNRQKLVN